MTQIPTVQVTSAATETGDRSSRCSGELVDQIDHWRRQLSSSHDLAHRRRFGQFMTSASVARTMAKMFDVFPSDVRLLDAGAGMGSLTAAFVEAAAAAATPPRSIDVTAYEIDPDLAAMLDITLARCAALCSKAGIVFSCRVVRADYIQTAAGARDNLSAYTCAILNPPYRKITSGSSTQRALDSLGLTASNLYAAFVAVALTQLQTGGELVAITPRSFCNGPTHRAYRTYLLETAALEALHLYDSRSTVFGDDGVLQEVMVLKLRKSRDQGPIFLSSDVAEKRPVSASEIVFPKDPQRVIRLPLDDNGVAQRIAALPCTPADLELGISTGRVIEYRVRSHLRNEGDACTVPLIHPQHLRGGTVHWPIRGFRKNNALSFEAATRALTMPAGVYVVVKRVSAKEEAHRIQAALYSGGRVAFENHLNVFHTAGTGLPEPLARGLLAYLSSKEVDAYIRTVSGSTQVNATDLRSLRYPSAKHLEALGRGLLEIDDIP